MKKGTADPTDCVFMLNVNIYFLGWPDILPKDTLPKDILPNGHFADGRFAERTFC
jgi:hypothetical protein